jgi:flavin reductase (DIM6/NTAB) family NADH-FMN oxidoreductase RutF
VADESFDDLMAMLDYPAFVATTQADGVPAGCLVSFGTQTGVEPPTFLISLSKTSHTFEVARRAGFVAVHVLARHHRVLAELFGVQTGHQVNKFDRCSWRAGPQGMPILDDAIAWFVGKTLYWIDAGDHVAFLLQPVATWSPECDEDPLYLSDLDDLEPGHEASGRLFDASSHVAHRYGLRFTIDGL